MAEARGCGYGSDRPSGSPIARALSGGDLSETNRGRAVRPRPFNVGEGGKAELELR